MTHPDQLEFYTCPICGAGTGNDIDGGVEHKCPLEEQYVTETLQKDEKMTSDICLALGKLVYACYNEPKKANVTKIMDETIAQLISINTNTVRTTLEQVEREIDRLENEVLPKHAEENGYGCALQDMRDFITKHKEV